MISVRVTIQSEDEEAARAVVAFLRDGLTHSRFMAVTQQAFHPRKWHEAGQDGEWVVEVELESAPQLSS